MPIVLSHPLSVPEIRILQEFRRLSTDMLSLDAIRKIKHPAARGEAPAFSLADKGYLIVDAPSENFTLTDKAKAFLAIDCKPAGEGAAADGKSA